MGANAGKGRLQEIGKSGHWACDCGGCDASGRWNMNTGNIEIVTANLTRRGWSGFGKSIRCPECSKKRKPVKEIPAMAADNIALSKNTLRVGMVLADAFDEDVGRYRPGWDDARVGKEAGGIAPEAVARVRKSIGMEIKGDPELDALKGEIESLSAMVSELRAKATAIERRIIGK